MKTIKIELEDYAADQLTFLRKVAEAIRKKTGYCAIKYDVNEADGCMSILMSSVYVYPYKDEGVAGVFVQGTGTRELFLSPISFGTFRDKRMNMDDVDKVATMICRIAERAIAYQKRIMAFDEECEDE